MNMLQHSTRLSLLAILLTTACDGDGDATSADAAVSPPGSSIKGSWVFDRQRTDTTPGCPELGFSGRTVKFQPSLAGSAEAIQSTPSQVFAQIHLDDQSANFSVDELSSLVPAVIMLYDVHLDNDALVGTAKAQGDGEHINCRWSFSVTATRAP